MFATSLIRTSKRSSSFAVSSLLTALLATSFVVLGGAVPASAAACDAGVAEPTLNEDGDTYAIGTAAELIALSTNFELDGEGVWGGDLTFIQTADIDLAGCDWSPIGTADSPFVGTYRGEGFTVSGLKISSTTAGDVGFFGFVGDGSYIQELTVIGEIDIPLGSAAGGSTVGGIAGYIAGETYLSQVIADVDISILTAGGSGNIGGLVGQVDYGTIQYSGHRGDFLVTGNKIVGGLVGSVKDEFELNSNYSIATFDISDLTGYDSSGIIGDGCDGMSLVINTFSVASGQHWGVEREDCSTFQDTFYNTTTFLGVPNSDEDSVAGVLGQTTLEMKDSITYEENNWDIVEGWDEFDRFTVPKSIWGICSLVNDGYPFLLWEYSTDPCLAAATAPAITSISPASSSGTLSVAFTAPTSDGGAVISNYKYSIDNGATWVTRSPSATTSPLVIQGLNNGTSYQIKLLAINSVGEGAASTAVPGTPAAPAPSPSPTPSSSAAPATSPATLTSPAATLAVTGSNLLINWGFVWATIVIGLALVLISGARRREPGQGNS